MSTIPWKSLRNAAVRASARPLLGLALLLTLAHCSSDPESSGAAGGSAGSPQMASSSAASGMAGQAMSSGGASTAGAPTAGSNTTAGSNATAGAPTTGGNATAGTATAGSASGGTTASAGASSGGTAGAGTTHAGVWKVMTLGDSVTGTCYVPLLSKDLLAGGHQNFELVGLTRTGGCGAATVNTESHGGYGVTYLPANSARMPLKCTKQAQGCGSNAELLTWAAEKPDIVLMHFATNDVWDGRPVAEILAAYLAVLAEFRKQNPNVIFFVSKIIPLTPAPANAINLNAAVTPAWATTNSTATSVVHIIDHWTGFDAAADTVDGVHPNQVGAQKMATASLSALVAAKYF